MTLCIAVKCSDGVLLACDSKTVYGRGVPISRETNKIHILEKKGIINHKVAIMGAGVVAFIDKFIRMFRDEDIEKSAKEVGKDSLTLSEVINKIAEPMASVIYDEYVKRREFKEEEISFDLVMGGFEAENSPDAFILYGRGLAEPIDDFGVIGSGSAYADLFLRYLLPHSVEERDIKSIIKPICYTIRLVETIDPFVGGRINLVAVTSKGTIENMSNQAIDLPKDNANEALQSAMNILKEVLDRR